MTLPKWLNDKYTAILACVISVVTLLLSYFHLSDSLIYIPKPQQVLLDYYHRPIGVQNLLEDTLHNPHYRTSPSWAPAEDFTKESLLRLFSYNKDELSNGSVYRTFETLFTEGEGEKIYSNIFINLSQPKIVMAQDGIVRSRLIGPVSYEGSADWEYRTLSGLKLNSRTHQFKGKIMITVHAEETYPTLYDFVIEVQRALLQDKISGYQILRLEIY